MREGRAQMNGMSILRIMNKIRGIFFCSIIALILTVLTGCNTENEGNDTTSAEEIVTTVSENKEDTQCSEEAVEYAQIDWEHYEAQMSEEDKEDFAEYKSVLTNQEKFFYLMKEYEEMSFYELLEGFNNGAPCQVEGIVLIDLDNQNGKELIIYFSEPIGIYLILTRDSGIYSTIMSDREFEMLQNDGKYRGSGGAGDKYFRRMKIDSSGVEETLIGEVHGEEKEDGTYGDRLEVGGKVISESLEDWMDENYNDPVTWIE